MSERFIILCGHFEQWVAEEEIKEMTLTATIDWVAGSPRGVSQIIGFDLDAGICRDATKEVVGAVMDKWGNNDERLTEIQTDFIDDHRHLFRSLPPSNIRPVSVRGLVSSDH